MKYKDTRIKYTENMLKEALLKLLKDNDISNISISKICDTAQINRSTFYMHYDSSTELLDKIENDFLQDKIEKTERIFSNKNSSKPIKELFKELITEDNKMMAILYKNQTFMNKVKKFVKAYIYEDWKTSNKNLSNEQFEIVFDFLFAGVSEVVKKRIVENGVFSNIDSTADILYDFGLACNTIIKKRIDK